MGSLIDADGARWQEDIQNSAHYDGRIIGPHPGDRDTRRNFRPGARRTASNRHQGILEARRGAVMIDKETSEEAKRALAEAAMRRAADRLRRDGADSDDALRRRVRALAAERNLPP